MNDQKKSEPRIRVPVTRGDHLLVFGGPGGIERQERVGQQDFLRSTELPCLGTQGEEEEWEKLGVTLGPVEGNDIFRQAWLPPGWKKVAHPEADSRWSLLLDAEGNEVAGIFYKAAFYDRSARISLMRGQA